MNDVTTAQSRPTIGLEEITAVADVLKSGQLAMGTVVSRFEREFKEFVGAGYACGVNSGTAALHLALLGLGVKPGDEVLVPSYACTALLNAARYAGAIPVPVDINERTLTISADDAAGKTTARTKAIIAVHTFGMAADVVALARIGPAVIEDCAHSVGGYLKGRKTLASGAVAAVYSFYPTKMMTTGEGGMLATSSEAIDRFARDVRSYDGCGDGLLRFNYKMTDIAAALGLAQLAKLEGFVSRRREIARRYDAFFGGCSGVTVPGRDYAADVFYRYVIVFGSAEGAGSFMKAMQLAGIVCDRPVFKPLHRVLGLPDAAFPATALAFERAVSIPVYPSLSDGEVDRIITVCGTHFRKAVR